MSGGWLSGRLDPDQPYRGRERGRITSGQVVVDTLLGLPVLFLVTAAGVGGVDNAATLYFFLVVCTLGVSLALILPMAWVAGTLLRRALTFIWTWGTP